MYSSPRWQCDKIAHRLLGVPVGTNSAASNPNNAANLSCKALTLGSSANTSSPNFASNMAARIAGVGCVTVSLRRSTFIALDLFIFFNRLGTELVRFASLRSVPQGYRIVGDRACALRI